LARCCDCVVGQSSSPVLCGFTLRASSGAHTAGNRNQRQVRIRYSLLTVLVPLFATQMLAPSNPTPIGLLPTEKVPRLAPSLARSWVTVVLPSFATQMLAPSNPTPSGALPTEKVPRLAPSLARSLVTLLLPIFATQMLAPSNATPSGPLPTEKVPRLKPSL